MPVRTSDRWGLGCFGAPRGNRKHPGLDLETIVGQLIKSPVTGTIIRYKKPYGDHGEWDDGVLIRGEKEHIGLTVTLFYCHVPSGLIGAAVIAGAVIGTAADLAAKFSGITNHVHIGVWQNHRWIDPQLLIFGATLPEEVIT